MNMRCEVCGRTPARVDERGWRLYGKTSLCPGCAKPQAQDIAALCAFAPHDAAERVLDGLMEEVRGRALH